MKRLSIEDNLFFSQHSVRRPYRGHWLEGINPNRLLDVFYATYQPVRKTADIRHGLKTPDSDDGVCYQPLQGCMALMWQCRGKAPLIAFVHCGDSLMATYSL